MQPQFSRAPHLPCGVSLVVPTTHPVSGLGGWLRVGGRETEGWMGTLTRVTHTHTSHGEVSA